MRDSLTAALYLFGINSETAWPLGHKHEHYFVYCVYRVSSSVSTCTSPDGNRSSFQNVSVCGGGEGGGD
jgi:hypothetical protein